MAVMNITTGQDIMLEPACGVLERDIGVAVF